MQPLFARMVLPLLGGAPAVWNTSLVFYPAALLLGYGYAHLASRRLGVRRQALLHLALLVLALLVLPIAVRAALAWSSTVAVVAAVCGERFIAAAPS